MGEAGPGEPTNGADPASDEKDRSEDSGAQDLEEARTQIEELKELHLRARAEADNIRKRAEAEMSQRAKVCFGGLRARASQRQGQFGTRPGCGPRSGFQ